MQFLSNSAAEVRNVVKHSYSEVSRPLSTSDTVETGDCLKYRRKQESAWCFDDLQINTQEPKDCRLLCEEQVKSWVIICYDWSYTKDQCLRPTGVAKCSLGGSPRHVWSEWGCSQLVQKMSTTAFWMFMVWRWLWYKDCSYWEEPNLSPCLPMCGNCFLIQLCTRKHISLFSCVQ